MSPRSGTPGRNKNDMEEIRGKSVLIVGYGREGRSVHAWLAKYYPALRVGIADRNVETELVSGEKYKGATVYNGEGYLFHLDEYDTIIRSPGISPYTPEIQKFLQHGGYMTSATNVFFSRVKGVTIGITGTKGKSTTSSLIKQILSAMYRDVRLVGNIGVPMLDSLELATEETVFVLELSSHQLFDCRYGPHIAVMLGIVSEHLDYYPNLASYANAKVNITSHQARGDYLVYNPRHTFVRELISSTRAQKIIYGDEASDTLSTFLKDGWISVRTGADVAPVLMMSDVPLLGNQENVLAAVTVSRLMNIPIPTIARAITPFQPLPHRLEFVGEFHNVRFYNDSLATIPQATIHALEALGSDVATLLVGGLDRHIDYAELGAYLRSHPVATLILFPDTGEKIWMSIGVVTKRAQKAHILKRFTASSMEDAVKLAYLHTPRGKICLLSPASASFNTFRDYADRGDQFKEWVKKIGTLPSSVSSSSLPN